MKDDDGFCASDLNPWKASMKFSGEFSGRVSCCGCWIGKSWNGFNSSFPVPFEESRCPIHARRRERVEKILIIVGC